MQGKYKTNYKCKKGLKKVKIKKYEEGIQKIDINQFGDAAGIAGGLGAIGLEGVNQNSKYAQYESGLKDDSQAIGRGIGTAAGLSLNAIPVVGGTLSKFATPLLAGAGGAIQRGLQKDKLKELKAKGDLEDNMEKANAQVGADLSSFQAKQYSHGTKKVKKYTNGAKELRSVGLSPNEKSLPIATEKNGKKTKIIEIEGKGTPEIHTDKDFNIKNLGTTPHSKGGDKVVAEEGDVVFPTQNSKKKYNEVMTAIMKKDKYKLKKEQNKLPEDKVKKYQLGGIVDETEEEKRYRESIENSRIDKVLGRNILSGLSALGPSATNARLAANKEKAEKDAYRRTYGEELYNKKYGSDKAATPAKPANADRGSAATTRKTGSNKGSAVNPTTPTPSGRTAGTKTPMSPSFPTSGKIDNPDAILNKYVGNKGWDVAVGRAGTGNIEMTKARRPDVKSAYNKESNDAARQGLLSGKYQVVQGKDQGNKDAAYNWPYYIDDKGVARQVYDEDLAQMKPQNQLPGVTVTPQEEVAKTQVLDAPEETPTPKKEGGGFNTGLLEYVPTAYNLGQGLFGNAEKVRRKEYIPKMEDYVDTSSNVRREINQGYKANVANARNLSGGLASNARSNAQSAVNNKIQQINSVDSQEYGKQLDVNNRNVGRINEGRKINLDLFNTYEDLDAQNRAKKSEALAAGLTSVGDIAGRDKLYKNTLQAKLIEGNTIQGAYNYGNGISTDGTQITGLNTDFRQGSGIPTNQYSSLDITKKPKKQSKGNKSIQVERKYKLKK